MKIVAVTMVYNEELLLPLFLHHYDYLNEIHVLYETDSSDRTYDILRQAPNVVIKPCHSEGGLDDIDKANYLTEALRSIRADWVYVLDCDEFIFPPGEPPNVFLTRQDRQGYNVVRAVMFQVYRHKSDRDIDISALPIPQRLHGDPDVTSEVRGPHRDTNSQYIKPIVIKPVGGLVITPGQHRLEGNNQMSPEMYYGAHWAMADPSIALIRRMSNKQRISTRNKQLCMGFQHWEVTEGWVREECAKHLSDPVIEELYTNKPDESIKTRMMLKVTKLDLSRAERFIEQQKARIARYQSEIADYQSQVSGLRGSIPMRLAASYQARVDKLLPLESLPRKAYDIMISATRIILAEGWGSLFSHAWRRFTEADVRQFGPIASIYLAHSVDDNVRHVASSGGFIKSFLAYLLDAKIVDYAIITRTGSTENPFKPETIITNSRNDILSPRTNSVYMLNDPLSVMDNLQEGKNYAFVGLPCHVRRLREGQNKGKWHQVRVVIGLFCSYTPDAEFTTRMVQNLGINQDAVTGIEYRGSGWPGSFTAYLKDGTQKSIGLQGCWNNDLGVAVSMCRKCSDIGKGADIMVGDPWNLGLEKKDPKGQSLVICRSSKADKMVVAANGYIRLSPCTKRNLVKSQGAHIKDKLGRRDEPKESTQRLVLRGSKHPVVQQFLRHIYRNSPVVWYWRDGKMVVNYGDYIAEVLIKAFGYKPIGYSLASALGLGVKSCLLVIGSELHKGMIGQIDTPAIHVWGQGKGHGEFFDIQSEPYRSKVRIHAVRGPYTLKQLNLDKNIPLGDPALLLPLFLHIERDSRQHKVSYVPHWSNRYNAGQKLQQISAERFINVMCTRKNFEAKVTEVVSSRFVLTNSLHTAIICEAYRTPWALCLPDGHELNFPDKWRDLFEYLGTDYYEAQDYKDGLKWWQGNRARANRPSLRPLLEAFPFEIKDRRIKQRIANLKECPICGWIGDDFNEVPFANKRAAAVCPACGSVERLRFAYLTLKDRLSNHDGTTLHVAPEQSISYWLESISERYLSVDIEKGKAMYQMDITDLAMSDNSVSLIWCSHVLEHIVEDRKAMDEMFRVLKPDGLAIILVPVRGDTTYEDETITSPALRLLNFGQEDHVRIYGYDVMQRLTNAGFDSEVIDMDELFSKDDIIRYGLDYPTTRQIFLCRKSRTA